MLSAGPCEEQEVEIERCLGLEDERRGEAGQSGVLGLCLCSLGVWLTDRPVQEVQRAASCSVEPCDWSNGFPV